jgi:hypothetical protein
LSPTTCYLEGSRIEGILILELVNFFTLLSPPSFQGEGAGIRLPFIDDAPVDKIKSQDWSLIARYLNDEANEEDCVRIHSLIQQNPELEAELSRLRPHASFQLRPFDADNAFKKLHGRFERENLI